MACYEVNLMSVEFKVANKDLLLETLKNLKISFRVYNERISFRHQGLSMEIDLNTQQITTSPGVTARINSLKREYTRTVITAKAKKNKWLVRNTQNKNQLRVVKY